MTSRFSKRDTISLGIILAFIVATVGLLWWVNRPVSPKETADVRQGGQKIPTEFLEDPRFAELRTRIETIDVGETGNPNPFEPFSKTAEPKPTILFEEVLPPPPSP